MPDKAVFNAALFTDGKEAQKVQDENSMVMNRVIAALKEAGVKDTEIKTSGYTLYLWEEWDSFSGKSVIDFTDPSHVSELTDKEYTSAEQILGQKLQGSHPWILLSRGVIKWIT